MNACASDDPTPEVREFEDRLATAFAIDSACHGAKLVKMTNPHEENPQFASAASRPNWWLTLNFNPGFAEQDWTLLSPNHQDYVGTGDASIIAHKICLIATQQGGHLAD